MENGQTARNGSASSGAPCTVLGLSDRLHQLASRAHAARAVCVSSVLLTWPFYPQVWRPISARVTGAPGGSRQRVRTCPHQRLQSKAGDRQRKVGRYCKGVYLDAHAPLHNTIFGGLSWIHPGSRTSLKARCHTLECWSSLGSCPTLDVSRLHYGDSTRFTCQGAPEHVGSSSQTERMRCCSQPSTASGKVCIFTACLILRTTSLLLSFLTFEPESFNVHVCLCFAGTP